MAVQLSVAVRNAREDAVSATIGTAAHLVFYTGAQPANCAAAAPTGVLVDMSLPSAYLTAAAAGSKSLVGTWSGVASGAGVAASWRLYDTAEANCHAQGTVTATGLGGDLTLDNTNINTAQTVSMANFTLTDGNA